MKNTLNQVIQAGEAMLQCKEVLESKETIGVVFVDMCGSTKFKESHPAEIWLPRLCFFLSHVSSSVASAGGYVAKYIGDEVMGVFLGEEICTKMDIFVEDIMGSQVIWNGEEIALKMACDFGPASLLKFKHQPVSDPQGILCDRTARLMNLAREGVCLSGKGYRDESGLKNKWRFRGTAKLRGVQRRTRVYQYKDFGGALTREDLECASRLVLDESRKVKELERKLVECRSMLHDR